MACDNVNKNINNEYNTRHVIKYIKHTIKD